MLENQKHNKSKSDKGYHAVPPPFTGNFIPRKPDLTFMDEIVESENMDVTTVVTPSNVKTVESNHESAGVKSNGDVVEPKTVRKNSFRPPINPQQKEYKEKEVINSGCLRHMIGNKCYLIEYTDYDGGFVSFRDGKEEFSVAKTPQQNGVAERRNRTLIEAVRTILGTRDNIVTGQAEKKTKPEQEYILIPICTTDPLISQGPKDSEEDSGIKPTKVDVNGASDKDGEDDQATRSVFERLLQQKKQTNSTNSINTFSTHVSTARPSFTNDDPSSLVNTAEASNAFEEHLFERFSPFKNDLYSPLITNVTPTIYRILMDVKSAFLYGTIEEEVYVCQPPGFEDPQFPDKVYKVEKALYGLHQASRAWYETFSTYLIENGFRRDTIDKTLFIKKDKGDILLVQVYVDDIIFGSTKKSLCDEFEGLMHKRFQMSSMGELTFFLGLQVQHNKDGIFISQDKYVAEVLKKFDFSTVKTASAPMEPNKALIKYEEADSVDVHLFRSMIGSLMYLTASRPDPRMFLFVRNLPFALNAFSDSDYAGANLDRESTTGGCQFLGKRLISLQCNKQTIVANSTTEAECVAAANCCGQIWMKGQDNPLIPNPHPHLLNSTIKKPIIVPSSYQPKKTHKPRKAIRTTEISQSSGPINLVADETVYKEWEDRMGTAATTASSLDVRTVVPRYHIGGVDAQTRFETTFKKSNDPPLSRGYTLGSGDDSMKLLELVELCTKLSDLLEDVDGISSLPNTEIFEQLALIGQWLVQGPIQQGEGSTVLVESHHTPITTPSTSQPPLSSPSRVPTPPYDLPLPREDCQQSEKPKLQEEIDAAERHRMAKVHQAAQGFKEDEWENIRARVEADEELTQKLQAEEREKYSEVDQAKMLVDLINQRKRFFAQQRAEAKRNKPMTQAQQRTYMSNYIKNQEGGYSIKQLKSLSFEEVKEIFETTMRRVHSFMPMDSELEVQRLKRAGSGEEQSAEKEKEVSEEELQKLLVIVPVEEVYIEALQENFEILDDDDTLWKLQRYMHDPLKWRFYDTCDVHRVSI
ncbi:putative ribonuclease H-like domain-containing protein [Tanacetum coccineum]